MTADAMDIIHAKLGEFNRKVAADERLASDLEGIHRTILLDMGERRLTLELRDKSLAIVDDVNAPDVRITTTAEVLVGIFNGDVSPMRAMLVDRTLKVEASLEDKLRLRKLFQ
ncbi:MAG: SCP2 sterol-binding domain-containing protein [Thermoplasmata archaeon]|nr:SCP2 sterol-binding domain-containing protein [Thermoplasmata archaeon]